MDYERFRNEKDMEGLEREYMNFMESYHRMISYNSKLKGRKDKLNPEELKRVEGLRVKMTKRSEQIYRRLHETEE